MTRLSLFAALAVALAAGPSVAQTNPVFNEMGKSWVIRYGTQKQDGNKREDIAVLLHIAQDGTSADRFQGTLKRYDGVIKLMGTDYYTERSTPDGSLTFQGRTKNFKPGKPRRPVRFEGYTTFLDEDGNFRLLKVFGTYHAGSEVTDPMTRRKDDRLVLSIVEMPVAGAQPKGPPAHSGQPTPASTSMDKEKSILIAHYVLHPCEEEPDVDILSEETAAPDDALPVDPAP